MKEIGDVIKAKNKLATVRLIRKSSCENCNQCGLKKKDTHIDIVVENELDAEIGDQAVIEMTSGNVFKSAFIVYAVPLILSLLGLLVSSLLKLSELLQIIFIFGGLLIGGLVVYLADKRLKKQKFSPRIVEVIKKQETKE
ncbi:MAG: SoxR reducing system RseC family protein [Clostridia bacterium]